MTTQTSRRSPFAPLLSALLTTIGVPLALSAVGSKAHAQAGHGAAVQRQHGSQPRLDNSSEESLKRTQDLLRNQRRLESEGLQTPEAKAQHQRAKELMGSPENTAALYDLSADIFGPLAAEAGGDPVKMQEILQKALANPEAFAARLTPEQRARLKDMATKAEARKPSTAQPR